MLASVQHKERQRAVGLSLGTFENCPAEVYEGHNERNLSWRSNDSCDDSNSLIVEDETENCMPIRNAVEFTLVESIIGLNMKRAEEFDGGYVVDEYSDEEI